MNIPQLDFAPLLQRLLAPFAGHPLLERLFFASLELAVLALLVFIAIRFCRIRSARLAALLWLLVLGKPLVSLAVATPFHLFRMEVPPAVVEEPAPLKVVALAETRPVPEAPASVDVPSPFPEGVNDELADAPSSRLQPETRPAPTAPPVALVATPASPVRTSPPWSPVAWILGIWLTGVVFFAATSLIDRVRIWRLVRASRKPEPRLSDRYVALAANMGVKRPASLRVTDEIEGPALAGSIFSTILIPGWLAEEGHDAKLDWALRHELMHFRLRDPWAGLIRELSQMLFFFHPVAWWAGSKWKTATEKACDRAIVADVAAARDYAEQLYGILVGIHGRRHAALRTGLFATRTQIGQRIATLLHGPRTAPHLSALAIVAVTVVAAVTLSVGGAFADKHAKSDVPDNLPASAANEKPHNDLRSDSSTNATGDLRVASVEGKTGTVSHANPEQEGEKKIRGRVLLPDGRPAVSAKASLVWTHMAGGNEPWQWTSSAAVSADERGNFAIPIPAHPAAKIPDGFVLVVTAGGCGVEYVPCGDREMAHPVEVKLPPDQPVRGRIVDLEGKPVAGARVRVVSIHESLRGDLGPWLAAMKSGVQRYSVAAHALLGAFRKGVPVEGGAATTDGAGRFTLTGLGAERIVDLAIESERTAYADVTVATRKMEPIIRPSYPNNAEGLEVVGAEFTKSLQPTRHVVGVVRDAETKKPLAGVSVESWQFAGQLVAGRRDIKTTTDAQGRYWLIGLPKGPGNAIFVVPNDEQPYFLRSVDVPNPDGMVAVTVDIELRRGVWITGRVTDKETGQPVLSLINYWPFLDNAFTPGRAEFGQGNMQGDFGRYHTREDGSFRVPGLPGHGLVGAVALGGSYRQGAGATEIGNLDGDNRLRTFRSPGGWPSASFPTTMKAINPADRTENVVCDLVCDHGETVQFTVLDPTGKPVDNCSLSLNAKNGKSQGVNSPFELNNLTLDKRQPLLIEQKERKLGKFLVFTLQKESPRSLTVRLEPTMTVSGRLVDQDGVPLSGISVQPMLRGAGDYWPSLPAIVCGSDGRFEYTGLADGQKVEFQAVGTAVEFLQMFGRTKVTPGKRVDLGDVKLKRRNSGMPTASTNAVLESPPPAKAKNIVEVPEVHGRVLLPDGKPASGARVVALRRYWVENVKRTPIAKTTAGPDGAFTIAIPQNTPVDDTGTAAGLAWIGAEAEGFGTGYVSWRKANPTQKELVIKLLPEVPIHGRIVDLEGKPVAGAHVAVNWQESPRQEFGSWLDSLRAGSLAEFNRLNAGSELQGYEDDSKPPVVTDAVGRFTLSGIGADRVTRLAVHGDLIADASIDVVTRPIKPFPRQTGGDGTAQVFGADFTFQAAPTRLIVGTVRDGSTGVPLAGVSLRQLFGSVHTETDSQGRYRLVGLPKLKPGRGWGSRYLISILPSADQPYPAVEEFEIPYSAGLDPITLDIKLPRGVWITGRVTDKENGAPAMSAVWYFPALSNPLLKEIPNSDRGGILPRPLTNTAPDGTFRVVGLPGRGVVAVRGIHKIFVGAVEASRFAELAKNYPKGFQRQGHNINAIQEIEPAQGTASVTCDLLVSAGGTMRVLLADPQGKSVSPCVFFYDMPRGALMNSRADQSPFELTAFEPDESRPIVFHYAKNRIGKALVIHYDEKSPHSMTVTLEPWATVKGRIVDADGVPRKGEHVEIHAKIGKKGFLPAGSPVDCDAEGRFVCDNLAPGADSYEISTNETRAIAKFAVVAGRTIDLGDIKPKRDDVTVSASKPDVAAKPAPSPAKLAVEEMIEVHGRVLLPAGMPAAGARVLAVRRFFTVRGKRSPVAQMTVGPKGEFTLRLPKIQPADNVNVAAGLSIVAEARGFGTQWRHWGERDDTSKEIVLKLVPEVPIHGQILNLEGRPVGGVRVEVAWQNTIDDDFELWLQAMKAADSPFQLGRPVFRMPGYDDESRPPIVTDRDGRFTLSGIGADHLAELELRGDTIAYAAINVVAHAMRPVTFKDRRDQTSQLFGADYTYQVAPTRPIVGTVRDATTGVPVAGVSIESERLAGNRISREGVVRTVTDAEGKYRLIGMPKGKGSGRNEENVIAVVPDDDQPYFVQRRVKVPETAGLGPVTLDFKLTRGLWITGRATDKGTGDPVRCSLIYAPFRSNTYAADHLEFKDARGFTRDMTRNMARPDGTFRLLGLPGRGVVAAKSMGRSYRVGVAASQIEGMTVGRRSPTFLYREVENAEALAEINPAPGTESVTCNLVFDRGGTVRLSLVDSAGQPAGRCVIRFNAAPNTTMQSLAPDSTFELSGLAPHESRRLVIQQGQRRIGKVFLLHYDEKGPSTLTVTLEPCATVKGRLLDEDGVPLKHVRLRALASTGDEQVFPVSQGECGSDGRFELHNLPPGCDSYTIHANGLGRQPRFATVAEKVVVAAGKTIDLGEIKVKADK